MKPDELKAYRKRLGMTLARASKQVGVTSRTWCRWESGETPIPEGALKLFLLLTDGGVIDGKANR